ncbi:PPC domain-containing DNA-binding protein [Mucilaginibacter sp. PPCGB 2223]|uniref:PPC domain-containing DNA-binding protein n=1 Tax=Mucilaginibacter sp. PPCGB 2223 TaxID=1886027 RepID=UPI0009F2B6F3|nr:PPC domain-containing DNA-binding protein [Mucilaginibacter sp. PPCGB 2223]
MLKNSLFAIFVSLITITASAQDEYVKPGQVVTPNAAPGMRFKLLNETGRGHKTYLVVMQRGDDVLSGLTEFAEKNNITFASFTGLGAMSSTRIGCYDREKQMYHIIPVKGQAETVSFIGNITLFNSKPVVHVHMSVSQSDGTVRGGHLFQATVWPTLEVIVTVEPIAIYKKKETDTGFALTDPDLTQ